MKKIIPHGAVLIPEEASKVFSGQVYDVYQWQQPLFDGSQATFEMLKRADTVAVLPVVGDKLLVIEDEQPHSGKRLSFPGGRVDAGEGSTLAAAQREIKEETGYEFDSWKLIEVVQPHSKLEWFRYAYVAWGGRKAAEPHLDAGEKIEIKLLSFAETKQLVLDRAGYLGGARDIFEKLNDIEALVALPEFSGTEVDR